MIDVLIVGAGPTGLTMACELLRRGIQCRLIDKSDTPSQNSKAVGIHSRTLEVFNDIGIVEQVLTQGIQMNSINVYEGNDKLLRLSFQNLKVPYPFGLALPQSETEHLLLARLYSLGGKVERSKELMDLQQDGDRIIALVHHHNEDTNPKEEINTNWLIGCDGARSQVRKALNINFEGSTYEEDFVLADVDLDWNIKHDEMHIWLHEDGVFVAGPLPKRHQWRLIANFAERAVEEMPEATVELFQQFLRERKGDTTTTISNPMWLSNFKIHRRLVSQYRKGRVFLVGDAAHIHSPVGGQGMNTGIQDAYNLAWKIALVVNNESPTSLLDTYETERRPIAKSVLATTHASTKLLVTQNPALRFVRNHLLLQLLNLEFIQPFILKGMAELDLHYRNSSLSQEHYGSVFETKLLRDEENETPSLKDRFDFQSAPRAGDRAPQGSCQRYLSWEKTNLFREFFGTRFALLLFDGLSPTAAGYAYLVNIAKKVESLLGDKMQTHIIVAGSDKPTTLDWNGCILLDSEYELHKIYGAKAESLYLIRPDGYIGFRSQPIQEEKLYQYLSNLFFTEKDGLEGIQRQSK